MEYTNHKVPEQLYERIVSGVRTAERKRFKRRLYFSFFATVGSLSACIPTAIWLYEDMTQSGFFEMFKLAFSDTGVIANHWGDFSSSLLELLPLTSLLLCLSAAAALLLSLSFFSSFFTKYQHSGKFSFQLN